MDSIYNYNSPNVVFRFDDISVNSVMNEVNDIAFYLKTRFPDCRIIYGISPLVFDMTKFPSDNQQRVFPKIFSALSAHKGFYEVKKMGIPEIPEYVERASHGLFHVDHRLLDKECQDMSIMASCCLVDSRIFIPPFNKWNKDTEDLCKMFGFELIKFEDGWRSLEHNKYDPKRNLWYLHHWAFGLDKVKAWLGE